MYTFLLSSDAPANPVVFLNKAVPLLAMHGAPAKILPKALNWSGTGSGCLNLNSQLSNR